MESNLSNFMQIEKAKNKILIFDFHNLCYRTIFVAANEFRNNQTKVFDRDPEMKDLYQYWKHIVLNAFFYICHFTFLASFLKLISIITTFKSYHCFKIFFGLII